MSPRDLVRHWRSEAERFRDLALESLARLAEEHAAALEAALAAGDVEATVDQAEAARICGVSERTIRAWTRSGKLEDVGNGRPRYRLADLPAKAETREVPRGYDVARDATELLTQGRT